MYSFLCCLLKGILENFTPIPIFLSLLSTQSDENIELYHIKTADFNQIVVHCIWTFTWPITCGIIKIWGGQFFPRFMGMLFLGIFCMIYELMMCIINHWGFKFVSEDDPQNQQKLSNCELNDSNCSLYPICVHVFQTYRTRCFGLWTSLLFADNTASSCGYSCRH